MKRYQLKSRRPLNRSLFLRKNERKSRNKLIWSLIFGIALVYAFFAWVLPNLIGSLSSLNSSKSQNTAESPVSENVTLAPPVLSIPFEATNSSTIQIRGYSMPKVKVEIYLDDELKTSVETQDDGSFITEPINLLLGTNNLCGKTVAEKGDKSLPSKNIRLTYDNEKPSLSIKEPADNQTIKGDKKVLVSGKTDPQDADVLTINDSRVIISSDGTFSQTIPLNDGDNIITVIASDAAGNLNQITHKVIFEP